ncbi:unnamed protein product [Nezara viridula]|uniref:Uncharacterized protein n=1 Tax=Nezara viridula TaxID=85310 RepID=A0A9P0MQR0_NEZVI|nr:unnamed protein product [Nezara viridula]
MFSTIGKGAGAGQSSTFVCSGPPLTAMFAILFCKHNFINCSDICWMFLAHLLTNIPVW